MVIRKLIDYYTHHAVVVRDEHVADGGVERDVHGAGEVGGDDDGVVDALEVEDVDLLSEGVHHVDVVADPVDGDGHGRPGARHSVVLQLGKNIRFRIWFRIRFRLKCDKIPWSWRR